MPGIQVALYAPHWYRNNDSPWFRWDPDPCSIAVPGWDYWRHVQLFGKKLWSLQSVSVSASYSIFSIFLGLTILLGLIHVSLICLGIACLIIGSFPLLTTNQRLIRFWSWIAVPLDLLLFLVLFEIYNRDFGDLWPLSISLPDWDDTSADYKGLLVLLPTSILCDFLFITLNRWVLRWSAGLSSFPKILGLMLIECILAGALTVGVILSAHHVPDVLKRPLDSFLGDNFWGVGVEEGEGGSLLIVGALALSNTMTALFALGFAMLALVALIHRLFWPLLGRPIYSLQGLGIARRGKLLGTIGLILIGIAIGVVPAWLNGIVERLSQ